MRRLDLRSHDHQMRAGKVPSVTPRVSRLPGCRSDRPDLLRGRAMMPVRLAYHGWRPICPPHSVLWALLLPRGPSRRRIRRLNSRLTMLPMCLSREVARGTFSAEWPISQKKIPMIPLSLERSNHRRHRRPFILVPLIQAKDVRETLRTKPRRMCHLLTARRQRQGSRE